MTKDTEEYTKKKKIKALIIVPSGMILIICIQLILLVEIIKKQNLEKQNQKEVQRTVTNYINQSQAQATVIFSKEIENKNIEITTIVSKCSYGIIKGQRCEDISEKINECTWFTTINNGSTIYVRCIKLKETRDASKILSHKN